MRPARAYVQIHGADGLAEGRAALPAGYGPRRRACRSPRRTAPDVGSATCSGPSPQGGRDGRSQAPPGEGRGRCGVGGAWTVKTARGTAPMPRPPRVALVCWPCLRHEHRVRIALRRNARGRPPRRKPGGKRRQRVRHRGGSVDGVTALHTACIRAAVLVHRAPGRTCRQALASEEAAGLARVDDIPWRRGRSDDPKLEAGYLRPCRAYHHVRLGLLVRPTRSGRPAGPPAGHDPDHLSDGRAVLGLVADGRAGHEPSASISARFGERLDRLAVGRTHPPAARC